MVKKIIYSLIAVILIFSISGCSKQQANKQTISTSTGSSVQNSKENFQREKADLNGEVSEIIGNEVTLKVIKTPELPEGFQRPENGESGFQRPQNNQSESGQQQGEAQGQFKNRLQREYTGEEKSIIIPVGIKIYTISRGENGREGKEVSINEIKTGSILQVFYGEDGKTIEKIMLSSGLGGRRNDFSN